MTNTYPCPVDDCDKSGELGELIPHIVHTDDTEHTEAARNQAWQNLEPSSTNTEKDESTTADESEAEDDVDEHEETAEDDSDSSSTETDEDENDEESVTTSDDLERQRENLTGSTADEDTSTTDEDSTPSDTPSIGSVMPSFDTRTIVLVGGILLLLVVGYHYLNDGDDSVETVESHDVEEEDDQGTIDSPDDLEGGLV